jgi:phosphate transport system protein
MDEPDPLTALERDRREHAGSRQAFQAELAQLERRLVRIGQVVAEAIVPLTEAFLQGDRQAADEAAAVSDDVAGEATALEDACYTLIARQAPVAGDLRRVGGMLRSTVDVQRSAQLLRHVAAALTWVHPPALPERFRDLIRQLGEATADIFAGGADAWVDHDGLAANELAQRDDRVDLLQKYLLTELYTQDRPVEEAVSLALVARYYERIADHAVEVARQVAYFVTGERP